MAEEQAVLLASAQSQGRDGLVAEGEDSDEMAPLAGLSTIGLFNYTNLSSVQLMSLARCSSAGSY